MNYKNLLFAWLFLPIFGYAQDDADRLKNLKELKNQLKDIKELKKMVSGGEEILRDFSLMYQKKVRQAAEQKKEELDALAEKNNTTKMTLQEVEQSIFDEDDLICEDDFMHLAFPVTLDGIEDLRCALHDEFAKEFSDPKNLTKNYSSPTIFLFIRAIFEHEIMIAPTREHKECLQRLITITKEVYDLDKRIGIGMSDKSALFYFILILKYRIPS